MKYLLLLFICFACTVPALTQTSNGTQDRYLVTTQGDTIRISVPPGEFFPIFTKSEMAPFFPGGAAAWSKFLKENLVYPDSLKRKGIEGIVWLQFIVYTDGRICDLNVIGGVEALKEAALATMRKSPNWEPANQGGRIVACYQKQQFVFRL